MPTLICDLRPQAAELESEYRSLHASGEALALYWPAAGGRTTADWASVQDREGLDAAWENERLAVLPAGPLPIWLGVEDFHRVVLVSAVAARAELAPAEANLVTELLDAGAEAVELLPAAEVRELAQSWCSGRRAGAILLR